MEESDLTILDDKSMLSVMTESNSEMNHLLFQTDCLLSTAESQLETIEAEDKTVWVGDNDPTLLINDISGDLFKGLTSELNFSTSFSQIPSNELEPSDGKNLDEMLNESITAYNTMFDVNGNEKVHVGVDKTLTNLSVNVNKITYSTPYAVGKNINEMLEDLNCSLRAYNSEFEISGCGDLDCTLIEPSNQHDEVSSATLTSQNNDECNETNETEQSSIMNNNDSNVSTNNSYVTEDFGQTVTYQEPQAVDNPSDMDNSCDITELTPSKAANHSEINEKQSISALEQDKPTVEQINITKHDDNTVINISTTQIDDNSVAQSLNVTDEIVQKKLDISQESNQIGEQLLKRKSLDHPSTNEANCKKLKSDAKEHEPKNDSDDESLAELQNTIDANFTMAIFDPNETADNIDPGWNGLRELRSSEDYFQSVRDQWRSLSLPNPHRDITRRYVDKPATNNQQEQQQQQHGFQDKDRSIPCDEMIDYRIEVSHQRLVALKNQRNNIRGSPGSKLARRKINRDIEETQMLIRNLEKNREEVKQINSFYHGGLGSWDAYFLTRTQACDVQQQDRVFEFQMNLYQSQ